MFTLYKPNGKNSGGAASFKVGQGGVFVEVLKQKTWDVNKKEGTFDIDSKLVIFLKDVELASMLRIIGKKEKFETVHVQKDNTTTKVSFTPWLSVDTLNGYGFSLSRGEKRASVSFNLNESEMLRQFLIWALQEGFKYTKYTMEQDLKKKKNKIVSADDIVIE